ncbi:IS3 family transposase [Wolbachia pipientis]|uniref:IS3 family transposase n=5 Tax=Wolbachia TaxID=953 RepID=UPI0015FAF6C1|nr:IS3 family transposase [Wolbachia pipientis]MBA8755984.1 IS3 family transposase [Wolbachia pipientis]
MAREYTAEFKLEAVKLANEQRKVGQPVAKVARDLGIRDSVLGKWMKKYNEKKSAANAFPDVAPYDKERFDLQKELAKVTRERDIKKKPWPVKKSKIFFYIVNTIKCRNYVGFSASGYYKWTTRKISSRESANKELLADIQKIYQASKCRYGAPKIHAELKALGKSCNLKTVQSIMQKNGIQAILRRKFKIKKQQTDSSSQYIRPKLYCRSTK